MKKKICLLLTLSLLISLFSFIPTAYADSYKTIELDDTCSIELPSACSYWKTSGGYKYYKASGFIVQIEVLNSTLSLSSEKSKYARLGLVADYDYSSTSVKCVYGLEIDDRGDAYSLIAFNSKQHGIRIGVTFNPYVNKHKNNYLHIINSIRVYDKKSDEDTKKTEEKKTTQKSGWVQDGNDWCYYEDNAAVAGWKKISGSWYFFNSKKHMVTGWLNDKGSWYLFGTSGAMVTGWYNQGNLWYYLKATGEMSIGWAQIGGKWYYMDKDGVMATSWQKIDKTWYYFDPSGAMVSGWLQSGGAWYYFNDSGAMVTGWKQVSGAWYYFSDGGAMVTGWYEDKDIKGNSYWYWFDKDGSMVTGWKEIDGQWEMFDDNGVWLYTWDGN